MASVQRILLFLLIIGSSMQVLSQNDSVFNEKSFNSFTLYNAVAGTHFKISQKTTGNPFSLFIFLSPECPLSQDNLPLLNKLYQRFGENVTFYGIIPGQAYHPSEITRFASTYHIRFPLLIDSTKHLSEYLYAHVTPEVILLDDRNTLRYKGAINDLMMTLGKRRVKVTNEYLQQAIEACLTGRPVAMKRTKAVGCKINDY